MRIAQLSAKKDGFGRPFFCRAASLIIWGFVIVPVWAQGEIYRCGSEYTNAPQDKLACVRMSNVPSVTVIEGTRPQAAPQAAQRTHLDSGTALVPSGRTKADAGPTALVVQRDRDMQARAILQQELEQARRLQGQLEESAKDPALKHSPEKLLAVKAAIERHQRDVNSLQRELARRPVAVNP
jgi:hypothetical protein